MATIADELAQSITAALNRSQLAIQNLDKILYGPGNVTVERPDGVQVTGPSWPQMITNNGNPINVKGQISTTLNIDTLGAATDQGIYFHNSTTNITTAYGYPAGAAQGYLIILAGGYYGCTQTYTDYRGNSFTRALSATWVVGGTNTWTPWLMIGEQPSYVFVDGDMNLITAKGSFAVTGTATNGPTGVTPYGILEVSTRQNAVGYYTQTYTHLSSNTRIMNRRYVRSSIAGVWSPWREQAQVGDASPLNLVRNAKFASNGYLPELGNSTGATLTYVQGNDSSVPTGGPNGRVAVITRSATGQLNNLVFTGTDDLNSNYFPVMPSDIIDWSMYLAATGMTATSNFRITISTYNSGTLVANTRVGSFDPAVTGWRLMSGSFTIPSGVNQIMFGIWSETNAPTGSIGYVSEPILTKRQPQLVGYDGLNNLGIGGTFVPTTAAIDFQQFDFTAGGTFLASSNNLTNLPSGVTIAASTGVYIKVSGASTSGTRLALQILIDTVSNSGWRIYEITSVGAKGSRVFTVRQHYTTANVTVDSNGFLKTASPVVKIWSDGSYDVNGEADGAEVTKEDLGVYRVSGVLGLNSDPAWAGPGGGFEIPVDVNKQALLWLDYEVEANGDIIVKTYHRTHPSAPEWAQNNIEGLENGAPCDIPDGRWLDVRVEMGHVVEDVVEAIDDVQTDVYFSDKIEQPEIPTPIYQDLPK